MGVNQADSTGQTQSEGDLPRPRRSLQLKATLAVVGFVTLSTGLCGYLTAQLAGRALIRTLDRDARMLAETAARGLADPLAQQRMDRLGLLADQLALDPRVAFVSITDDSGQPVLRRIIDDESWTRYTERTEGDSIPTKRISKGWHLANEDHQPLIVFTQPIWSDEESEQSRQLEGYIILAMRDPAQAQMLTHLRTTTIAVVGVICLLAWPLTVMGVRRLTRPLRVMLERTVQLAEGRTTEPIHVRRSDEVGVLARAFNRMAEKLSAARQQLEQANEDLEQQVQTRTAQLHEANEQLRQQMQDKDQFIRAITHDLNAPVRNIAGMTKMLLMKYENELGEEALSKLKRIAANARTEADLLADLLDLSRIRTQSTKNQAIDLNELLQSIGEGLSYDLEAHGIELHIADGMPPLLADRNRIRQVFQNLLDNAVKYMPEDSPVKRIDIGFEWQHEAIVFYVRDTGRGIAETDHQRIFQVFQRARNSGSTSVQGRGVGLASVKTIIETFGGRIWVESTPGQGACFCFTVDAKHLAEGSSPATESPAA